MSTTVSYKGNTLTSVENQTKILNTAGKYMEDDITIVDVTAGGGGYDDDDISSHNYNSTINTSVATIAYAAYYGAKNLETINAPNATLVRSMAFNNCSALKNVNLPNASQYGDGDAQYVFGSCTSLETIILPKWQRMWNYFFSGCTALKTVVMPALNNSRATNFNGCTALKTVDIGTRLTSITASFWTPCTSLDTVILRRTAGIVNLGGIGAFATSSPFGAGGTGGTLYVPSALISSYEAATNWSTILGYENNQILPIEGSIYETQYADGTPIGGAS